MKEIFINGRFLCRKPTGVDRYALEILRAINQLVIDSHPLVSKKKWTILTPKDVEKPKGLENFSLRSVGPFDGSIWEQVILPLYARNHLLLNLCNAAPFIVKNQLVVIHDATTVRVPGAFSKNFVRWYNFMIPQLLHRSSIIATVSNFSKGEIISAYSTQAKINVVREGADHFSKLNPDDSLLNEFSLNNRPYILSVGSLAPHKNFSRLIQAIESIDSPEFDCVIAGGVDPRVFSKSGSKLPDWVKYVGYITDAQLKSLYQHATCFVFPSIYEGYGLPPTEAMSEGCPVLCSNSASMPEVCGPGAIYFDPNDTVELAQHLLNICKDDEGRAQMRVAGLDQAAKLTWRNGAIDILNLLSNDATP